MYLHDRRIYHRDIKPENILLSESDPKRFVLADFNTAKDVSSGESSSTQLGPVGTMGYIAPEMYSAPIGANLEKADIFSLGCVFYYTLSDKGHPFGSVKELKDCQANINSANPPSLVEAAFVEHARVKSIIAEMVLHDAASRPNAEKIKEELEVRGLDKLKKSLSLE